MRIGIDATTIYTNQPTGLGVYSINIINELAKLHDDIVVWTVDDSALDLDKSKIRKVLQPFRFLGNHLFQLRPLWVESCLSSQLKREGIDVLYSTIPNGLACSPVPHVLTVHDLIPLTFPLDSPRSVRWNFKYRLPKIFQNSAQIIAVSEFTRQDVLQHYNVSSKKITTISEGFDRNTFSPKVSSKVLAKYSLEGSRYLLYVGSSSPRKNVSLLIKSFSEASSLIPHELVLVGPKSSEELGILKKMIKVYGLDSRVKLVNYVPYEDLPVLFTGADSFIFLSLYEGFGLPVLEAMACGTPVIAANTTSLPEVAGGAAILVDPCSVDSVVAAIVGVLSDERLNAELSQAGLDQSKKFSWTVAAENILKVLKHAHES